MHKAAVKKVIIMSKRPNFDLICNNDEGLPVRQAHKWSLEKLNILQRYGYMFITSLWNKGRSSINYIDLFSGPGKNYLKDKKKYCLGSPLIALSFTKKFDHYYFSDIKPKNIAALKQRCTNFQNYGDIIFKTGDANIIVDKIIEELKKFDLGITDKRKSSINLAFLDPEGLELNWSTVEKLAGLRTDMIIYYPQMAISRNAKNQMGKPPFTSIDLFFGDTHWRTIYKKYSQGGISLHRPLLDHYKEKLEGFGYQVKDITPEPVFTNTRGGKLYRLFFVSKHQLGNQFWNIATSKSRDGQERLF